MYVLLLSFCVAALIALQSAMISAKKCSITTDMKAPRKNEALKKVVVPTASKPVRPLESNVFTKPEKTRGRNQEFEEESSWNDRGNRRTEGRKSQIRANDLFRTQ